MRRGLLLRLVGGDRARGGRKGRRPPRPRRRSRGFSLIEVLTSSTVLLLGLAGTVSGIASAMDMYRHQRHMTQAMQICEGLMEELLLRYPSSDDLDEGVHTGPQFNDSGSRVDSDGLYQSSWTVTGDKPIHGIKEIVVTVTWTNGLRPVSLVTYRK